MKRNALLIVIIFLIILSVACMSDSKNIMVEENSGEADFYHFDGVLYENNEDTEIVIEDIIGIWRFVREETSDGTVHQQVPPTFDLIIIFNDGTVRLCGAFPQKGEWRPYENGKYIIQNKIPLDVNNLTRLVDSYLQFDVDTGLLESFGLIYIGEEGVTRLHSFFERVERFCN